MNRVTMMDMQETMKNRMSQEQMAKAENLQTTMNSGDKSKAEKAAQDFETMMVKMMLKSMTDSLQGGGFFGEQAGSDFYQDMYINSVSKMISENQSFGLSKMIMRQINNETGTNPGSQYTPLQKDLNINKERSYQKIEKKAEVLIANDTSDIKTKTLNDRLSNFSGIIEKASEKYGVDANLIRAVIAQESYGNPKAVSSTGAKGLMQLMDSTATGLGVNNSFDVEQNIMGGTKYLRQMLDRFNDEKLALAAYNAGPGNVEKYAGIPPFKETVNYVRNVMRYFKSL